MKKIMSPYDMHYCGKEFDVKSLFSDIYFRLLNSKLFRLYQNEKHHSIDAFYNDIGIHFQCNYPLYFKILHYEKGRLFSLDELLQDESTDDVIKSFILFNLDIFMAKENDYVR